VGRNSAKFSSKISPMRLYLNSNINYAKLKSMGNIQLNIEQLFDSPIKIRLLNLFLRNPETSFKLNEAAGKIGCRPPVARRHILRLKEIGFLLSKTRKGKGVGYILNNQFLFYPELKNLILKSIPIPFEKLKRQLKNLGNIKLAIISGIFLNSEGSRTDMLLVGERINQKKLNNFIKKTEQNIGKEVVYTIFDAKEFNYRLNVRDRFVRDIIGGRHEKLIQRLKI